MQLCSCTRRVTATCMLSTLCPIKINSALDCPSADASVDFLVLTTSANARTNLAYKMGNSSKKIGIHIEVNNPVVYPGEAISGIVHLCVRTQLEAASLILEFKGAEHTDLEVGQFHQKESFTLCAVRHMIAHWDYLEGGDFSAPFTIFLPTELIGSVEKTKHSYAWIEYFVKAHVVSDRCNRLAYSKHPITVKHTCDPSQYSLEHLGPVIQNLKSCCSDKGSCSFRAHLNQQIFHPNDTANMTVYVTAAHCHTDLKHISVQLRRRTHLRAQREHRTITDIIYNIYLPMVKAGTDYVEFPVNILIRSDNYNSYLPAFTVKSRLIQCEYYIEVRVQSRSLCRTTQCLKFDICFLPRYDDVDAAIPPPPIPVDWQPVHMEQSELRVQLSPSAPPAEGNFFGKETRPQR